MRRRRRRRRGAPPPGEPPHRRPASRHHPCRRGPDRSGRRGCEGLLVGRLRRRAAARHLCAERTQPLLIGGPASAGPLGRSCAPPGERPLAMGGNATNGTPDGVGTPLSARSRRTPWSRAPGNSGPPVATMRPAERTWMVSARSSTSSRLKWVIATTPSPHCTVADSMRGATERARRRRGPSRSRRARRRRPQHAELDHLVALALAGLRGRR